MSITVGFKSLIGFWAGTKAAKDRTTTRRKNDFRPDLLVSISESKVDISPNVVYYSVVSDYYKFISGDILHAQISLALTVDARHIIRCLDRYWLRNGRQAHDK